MKIYERHYIEGMAVYEREVRSVEVTIVDSDDGGTGGGGGAQCKSINDPHTTTFDGLYVI